MIRAAQIYVQGKTKWRLKLLTDIYPQKSDNGAGAEISTGVYNTASADEVADKLLNQVIAERYGLVLELERKQDALTKEFLAKAKET